MNGLNLNEEYKHCSSMGSGGVMAQEMLDMVDNLIDTSPRERISPQKSSSQSSIGILKYDNGNIYEGQLLNG